MKNKICYRQGAKPYRRPTVYVGGKQLLVSRVVMQVHLGRKLLSTELVHHKDENPFNNDVSNLQVVSRSEHKRIHAKIGMRTRLKKVWHLDPKTIGAIYKDRPNIQKIADQFGCTEATIRRTLKINPLFQFDLRSLANKQLKIV
jgi:HNH endonuclease